jgi:hypothetical protein
MIAGDWVGEVDREDSSDKVVSEGLSRKTEVIK